VLPEVLAALRRGEAHAVVVAKFDRLSRSAVDAGRLLEEARNGGFNIVALDLGLDLSTPTGELVANVLAAVAQWERRMIGQRTSEALRVMMKGGWVCSRRSLSSRNQSPVAPVRTSRVI
jgi:DNA invertase Pin-like site-specific DNA recombinase